MGLALSVALAFVPAFLGAVLLYWLDRFEKEPKRLLGVVFVWGALFATFVAVVAQLVLHVVTLGVTRSEPIAELLGATLFAPVTEELLKGTAVLFVFLVYRSEFDSVLDGIVYAGTVALGFAATEDVIYLYSGYRANGGEGLLVLFILRVAFGLWDHPFYTAFFGMGLALSRLARRGAVRVVAPLAGLLLAVIAHSLHNGLSMAFEGRLLGLALLLDWVGWLLLALVIAFAARSEGRLIGRELAEECEAGLIDAPHCKTAASSSLRLWAFLRSIGRRRARATRRFYQACAELAHKKNQLRRLGDEDGNLRRVAALRREIGELVREALS